MLQLQHKKHISTINGVMTVTRYEVMLGS